MQLGIDGAGDLITVFGDVDDLQPGQSVIQAYELTGERDRPLRLSVTAVPTDGTSDEPAGPAVRANGTPVIRIDEDAVDAGFGEGFDAAVGLLAGLWQLIRILTGFIIPLLVLVPFAWLSFVGLRSARNARRAAQAERIAAQRAAATVSTPPPPKRTDEPGLQSDPNETGADEDE